MSTTPNSLNVGDRIEIPVHFDVWVQGARHGVVSSIKHNMFGQLIFYVKMDNKRVKRRVKLLIAHLEYCKLFASNEMPT